MYKILYTDDVAALNHFNFFSFLFFYQSKYISNKMSTSGANQAKARRIAVLGARAVGK
jgi:hypothetical protein